MLNFHSTEINRKLKENRIIRYLLKKYLFDKIEVSSKLDLKIKVIFDSYLKKIS